MSYPNEEPDAFAKTLERVKQDELNDESVSSLSKVTTMMRKTNINNENSKSPPSSFYRALHSYAPTISVPAANGGHAYTVSLSRGDLVIAHTTQDNGWMYATILSKRSISGTGLTEGWIPGNYCGVYSDGKIRTLLEGFGALLRDCRGRGTANRAAEDYVGDSQDNGCPSNRIDNMRISIRRMVSAVQRLLRKTACLEKEAVVDLHAGVDRDSIFLARRNLLGKLSLLTRQSKALEQDDCDDIDIVQPMLHSAVHVVIAGAAFLDACIRRVEGGTMIAERPSQRRKPSSSYTASAAAQGVDIHDGTADAFDDQVRGQYSDADAYAAVLVPGCGVLGGSGAPMPRETKICHAYVDSTNFPQPVDACKGQGCEVVDISDSMVASDETLSTSVTNCRQMRWKAAHRSRSSGSVSSDDTEDTVLMHPRESVDDEVMSRESGHTLDSTMSFDKVQNEMQTVKKRNVSLSRSDGRGAMAVAMADTIVADAEIKSPESSPEFCFDAWKRKKKNAPSPTRDAIDANSTATNSTVLQDPNLSHPVPRHDAALAEHLPTPSLASSTSNLSASSSATFSNIQNSKIYSIDDSRLACHNIHDSPVLSSLTSAECMQDQINPSQQLMLDDVHLQEQLLPVALTASTSSSFVTSAPTSPSVLTFAATFINTSSPLQDLEIDAPAPNVTLPRAGALKLAHESFIGSLGSLVGSHLQQRESRHFETLKEESLASGERLFKLLSDTVQQDPTQLLQLPDSVLEMQKTLDQLTRVSKHRPQSCVPKSTSPKRQPLAERTTSLINIATLCVRSANDSFADTLAILQRIGEVDSKSKDLQALDNVKEVKGQDDVRKRPRLDTLPQFEDLSLDASPAVDQLPPSLRIGQPASQRQSLQPTPVLRSSASAIFTSQRTSMPATNSRSSRLISSPPVPPLPVQDIQSSKVRAPLPPRRCQSSPPVKRRRSSGELPTSATSSSSIERSHSSFQSQASTIATTPETSFTQDFYQRPLHDSFGPFLDSKITLLDSNAGDDERFISQLYAHELVLGNDGRVRGGTLRALIEKLTPFESTPEQMFLNTFYLSFRSFTTPWRFAEALIHRYECAAASSITARPIRLRVYNVFKTWLETYWRPETDIAALEVIAKFALGPLRIDIPPASKRLMQLVDNAVDANHRPRLPRLVSTMGRTSTAIGSMHASNEAPPPSLTTKHQFSLLRNAKNGVSRCNILDFDPLELARQITLLKSIIYRRIEAEELLAQEWRKGNSSKSPNVRAMSAVTTDLANLVIDTILTHDEARKRATIIKQWVKIARHARELCNYDTLKAILIALDSSPIHRLRKTWDLVSPRTMARLDELRPIIDSSRNWATLRGIMRNHPIPCLPSVSNYLTDLAFIDEGNTVERLWRSQSKFSIPSSSSLHLDYISSNLTSTRSSNGSGSGEATNNSGEKMINFEKYLLTARTIGELQRYQAPFRLTPMLEMQEWLEHEFGRVRALMTAGPAISKSIPGGTGAGVGPGAGTGGIWSDTDGANAFWSRSLKLEPRETSGLGTSDQFANFSMFGVPLRVSGGNVGGAGNGGGSVTVIGDKEGKTQKEKEKERFWNQLHLPLTLR